jgi:hypothetical protein
MIGDGATREDKIAELRKRIIARFDERTGSNSDATHGPLVEAILDALLPDEQPRERAEEAP